MEGLFLSVMELVCFLEYLFMTCMIGWICEIIECSFCACLQLKGTEHSASLELLRLFAHGTWSDYKSKCSNHLLMLR